MNNIKKMSTKKHMIYKEQNKEFDTHSTELSCNMILNKK